MNAGAFAGNWSSPLEYVWQPAGIARWARWRNVVWSETVNERQRVTGEQVCTTLALVNWLLTAIVTYGLTPAGDSID